MHRIKGKIWLIDVLFYNLPHFKRGKFKHRASSIAKCPMFFITLCFDPNAVKCRLHIRIYYNSKTYETEVLNMQRLAAFPLLTIDPYFSVWSASDDLANTDTVFWTGAKKRMLGYVVEGGKVFRFMGKEGGEAMRQTDVSVTAYETIYRLTCERFDLTVGFVSPRMPNDMQLLSMPSCLVRYEITPKTTLDGIQFCLFLDESCCYNDRAAVKGGVVKCDGFEAAFMGLERQLVLSNSQDSFSADWGYVYVAANMARYLSTSGLNAFLKTGVVSHMDKANEDKLICAVCVGGRGQVAVATDDIVSIYYFGQPLKGWYLSEHTVFEALEETLKNADEIICKCHTADEELRQATGGENGHYRLLTAALRQSAAAHKLVRDRSGRLLFLSKECHSNGCIATVDISYPSSPLYLLANPELLLGMLEPIFDFVEMPVWEFDFAPHDVGTYPLCIGQTYGLNNRDDDYACDNLFIKDHEHQKTHLHFYTYPAGNDIYDIKSQMPVEECGNMLILSCACYRLLNRKPSPARFKRLVKWADYLVKNGLIPSNQLCTDDFAGHLDQNANLSVKAIVGIGAMAEICKLCKKDALCEKYTAVAQDYAAKWESICYDGGRKYSPLTMDGKGAYSLKYNLLFDKLLGLRLFSSAIYEREVDAAVEYSNRYGAPLDERAMYTKADWLMWMSALTDDVEKQQHMIDALNRYLDETPSRCPFSDWYDSTDAHSVGFCNRAVVGGIFALLLKHDGRLLKK